MDPFTGYAAIQSQQHFWRELDEVLDDPSLREGQPRSSRSASTSSAHAAISSALQRFLALIDACYDRYLDHEYNRNYTVKRLLDSALFSETNEEYASECVVEQLRTATSLRKVLICYDIILLYGQRNPSIFRLIQSRIKDILFRLVHQIWAGFYAIQAEERMAADEVASQGSSKAGQSLHFEYARRAASQSAGVPDGLPPEPGWNGADWDARAMQAPRGPLKAAPIKAPEIRVGDGSSASIMRLLQIALRSKAVRMMYEVCRVQKLETVEMRPLDRNFLDHLFDLVEQTREHDDDSFNYQLIKLIVAVNEQFMVAGFANGEASPMKNTVLEVFRTRLNVSKTFGENLIFMLNRASGDAEDICMQLLVLKLLYLLFTTEDTAHYFYTNDLKVLVDVFIRELSDLPDESESLRHTYLRVLHPLLTNTQLCTVPYKRPQIRRLLLALVSLEHIRDVSATTKRLVDRCLRAEWCVALDQLTQGTPHAGPSTSSSADELGVAVAKVERIGGTGGSRIQAIQTAATVDGTSAMAQGSVDAAMSGIRSGTTLAVAAANVNERTLSVTSAIAIPGTVISSPMHSVQPSPSAPDAERSFDSDLSESLRYQLAVSSSSSSLPIPAIRTRDKRVSSVSHPKTQTRERGSTPPCSNGPHSSSYHVRTAPPTPPRTFPRRPPPPPIAQSTTPILPTSTAFEHANTLSQQSRHVQPLLAPTAVRAVRAPPPINRATKGTRSPAGTNSPKAQQTSFERPLRYSASDHY
ncbi:hypothetical protein CF319_g1709 [Tilletia indica]|nr:hypothetical protein CF319_g1709 [Tilletia indica]